MHQTLEECLSVRISCSDKADQQRSLPEGHIAVTEMTLLINCDFRSVTSKYTHTVLRQEYCSSKQNELCCKKGVVFWCGSLLSESSALPPREDNAKLMLRLSPLNIIFSRHYYK